MEQGVKERLIQIAGPENYTESLIDIVAYSYDASDNSGRPCAAIWPRNSGQVCEIMRLAWEKNIPVTPRGAGTGLAGSAVPAAGGIVLDMSRMIRILEISIADRLVVLEPGVVYEDLDRALAPYGFFFPPDPASGKVCTIGGNVATNAGGIRCAKYGVTRDYVLGLEVVLADGRLIKTGARCMKSVSGYDLTRLFVGSEGTLGIITEALLKLVAKPAWARTALVHFATLADAGQAVYEANATRYLAQLDAVEAEVKAAIARIPADRRKAITSHDAFGYFVKAYGIEFIAPQGVSTEAEASAKDVGRIIRQIKAEKIPAVFLENVTNPRLVERIAKESGAKVGGQIFSDALSDAAGPAGTYIAMMKHNISQIEKALAAGPA